MMNTKIKHYILIAVWLLFLLVFFFASGEVIVRFKGARPWKVIPVDVTVKPRGKYVEKHPILGWVLIPGSFDITLKKSYRFNVTHLPNTLRITHPLNSYIDSINKPEIWILGCSLTYGWSLNDDQTYPWILQKRFSNYEIVNFGVGGYGTTQSLLQFKEALRFNTPKVAILVFSSFHGARNTYLRSRRKETAPWNKLGSFSYPYVRLDKKGELMYKESKFEFLEFPLMRKSAFIHFIEKKYNKIEKRLSKRHIVSQKLIMEMARVADEFNVILVVAGITNDVNTQKMLSYLKKKGIYTVDISVDLSKKGYRNLPYDRHPSALANKEYADNIEMFLKREIMVQNINKH